jgi:hypothetical protein
VQLKCRFCSSGGTATVLGNTRHRTPKVRVKELSYSRGSLHELRVKGEPFINVLRSRSSQDSERFELPDRSKIQKPEHPSNGRRPETKLLRPSRTPFEYSNPASSEAEFGLRDPSVPKTRRASGPRTGALGRLQFVRACCHSVVASPSRGSVPIPQARAPFGRCVAPTFVELRRPPADRLVKLETAAGPGVERRSRHRTPSRTPRDFLPRV